MWISCRYKTGQKIKLAISLYSMLEVRRKPSESSSALLHRFSKIVKQSGILRESKKRRYRNRPISKLKRKLLAIRRAAKKGEYQKNGKKEGR